jgi:6-phosphofructokinase 2
MLADDTTRILTETRYAAGKGIDVSRVIRELGGQSVALGLVGGYDGMELEGLLINAGVMTSFTRISGETRTNIILKEKETARQFLLSAPGPEVRAAEIGRLYDRVREIQDMSYLVMSGSLPAGVTPNLYGQLILAGKNKGAFTFLDTDGKTLRESLDYQPTAIKPNIFELSRLIGRPMKHDAEILEACEEIHQKGIAYVLVSMGKNGIILSSDEDKFKVVTPPVTVESVVGAGDSAVAGFVLAHSRGKALAECLRLACAAGAATAKTPGTELCHREEVERILPHVKILSI